MADLLKTRSRSLKVVPFDRSLRLTVFGDIRHNYTATLNPVPRSS